MARDETIFVVGEGIGVRGGNFMTTAGLYDLYGPERLRDTPIVERGFVGMCTGAAMTGTRPVVDFMFFDFVTDAFGEMINQTAKMQYMSSGRCKMPIVMRGAIGIGGSNATHHSGNYYPFFAHVPGWRVVVPTTPRDAKGLMKTALRSDDPVLFLEHKTLLNVKGPVPEPEAEELIPFGKAAIRREGTDVTAVAIGAMVYRTAEAADALAGGGISVEVVDLRSIAPLDIDTILESVAKTGRLIIVDEDFQPAGMGAEISALVTERGFDSLDAPIRRVNGLHTPVPYSPALEAAVVPNRDSIAAAIRSLMAE
jgi:2-oxoisovalerate dehydrogenase E1 component